MLAPGCFQCLTVEQARPEPIRAFHSFARQIMNLREILANDVGGAAGPGDYSDLEDDDMSQVPVVDDHDRRLRELAQVVLASPDHLQMESWHSDCGTSHCIAGWAIRLAGEEGARLAALNDPEIAGYILLGPEAHGYFYSKKEHAIAWLQSVLVRP